ncbi:hypothetical protein GCM10027277_08920 [Pseudoduganella ginsengisoli]|uniref:DUF1631 family protein n=1 Tax=Pseudoduganella ginsengisoli TaxID=1462440 RepID=A0A6L6Q0K8_9BURK|nr:DUF1631 family protein [Pseudoduganella ginsengisoli]MTW03170.1 DUF1631 family protein [Pseudoduganella ginsengisoli]
MQSDQTNPAVPKKAVTPRHALLENLIDIVHRHVGEQFLDFTTRVAAELIDGDLGGDASQVAARIRAGNLLRSGHYGYLSLFKKELEKALRHEIAELAPGQKARPKPVAQSLSLVSMEEMDTKVALGTIAKPFEVQYSDALATLNVRLAFLLDRDILRVNQNPFRPDVILGALQQAWLAFTQEDEVAELLLSLLKPALFMNLTSMFDELNDTLQRKAEQPGSVDSYKTRKADSHDASSASPARQRKQQAELANQLRQFFGNAQEPAADPSLLIPDLPDIANLKAGSWAQGPAQNFQGDGNNQAAQRAAQTASKQPLFNFLSQVQQGGMAAGGAAPGMGPMAPVMVAAGGMPAGGVRAYMPGGFAMPAGGAGQFAGHGVQAHALAVQGGVAGAAQLAGGGIEGGMAGGWQPAGAGFSVPGVAAAGFPAPGGVAAAGPAMGAVAGTAVGFIPGGVAAGGSGLLALLSAQSAAWGAIPGAASADGAPGAAQFAGLAGLGAAPNVFYLPSIKQHAPQGTLTRADESTIDLLSAVFDTVFQDQNISKEIRDLMRFLQIPVLKAALVDKDFFFQEAHPARRLIDLLSRMGWEQRKSPDDPLFQAMQRSIERVGRDHDHEKSVFTEAVNELEASLKADEAAEATAMAAPIAAALKQEKMAEAARSAKNAVALRLGTGEVVAVVEAFLENRWVNVLTLAYSVEEEKPGAVKHATQTMDDLIWSVKPKISAEERKQLIGKLPGLLTTLNKWLDIIKWQDAERLQFFAELAECHASIVRAPLEVSPERQVELAMEAAKKAAERRQELAAQAAAKAQAAPPPAQDDDAVVAADSLARGDWLEFDQEDGAQGGGATRKVKLAWISPRKTLYIFSTHSRQEAFSLSGDVLAQKFRDGKVRVYRTEGLVGRALSQAIGQAAVNDAEMAAPGAAA